MTTKPRLLIIGSLPPPFIGPSIALQRLVTSTRLTSAFEISFLDISDRRHPENMGRFDIWNLVLGIKHAAQSLRVLLLQRPDVVYLGLSQGMWGYLRDLAFILPALILRRPVVLHLRGSEFRQFYDAMPTPLRLLTRAVLARVASVIVLGERIRRIFDGLIATERVVVIPNGIHYEDYRCPHRSADPSAGKRILFLSSLRARKGAFLLIEALPEVFRQHPDAQVTFTGRWRSSAEEALAMDWIHQLGIAAKCRFAGEMSGEHKIQAYGNHDIFVFPPIEPEGLPWVILEAMSAGLPVVTTDQGAIAEVVQDGITGYVVPPLPGPVAQGLCRLLRAPDTAKTMGEAGRRRIAASFSESDSLTRIVALLSRVADAGSSVKGTLRSPIPNTHGHSEH